MITNFVTKRKRANLFSNAIPNFPYWDEQERRRGWGRMFGNKRLSVRLYMLGTNIVRKEDWNAEMRVQTSCSDRPSLILLSIKEAKVVCSQSNHDVLHGAKIGNTLSLIHYEM
jgi:hypothetical protein